MIVTSVLQVCAWSLHEVEEFTQKNTASKRQSSTPHSLGSSARHADRRPGFESISGHDRRQAAHVFWSHWVPSPQTSTGPGADAWWILAE